MRRADNDSQDMFRTPTAGVGTCVRSFSQRSMHLELAPASCATACQAGQEEGGRLRGSRSRGLMLGVSEPRDGIFRDINYI